MPQHLSGLDPGLPERVFPIPGSPESNSPRGNRSPRKPRSRASSASRPTIDASAGRPTALPPMLRVTPLIIADAWRRLHDRRQAFFDGRPGVLTS